MRKKAKDYSVSLDIGTASVGWVVVDNDYNILKHKGNNMWGARLFDEAMTAVDRRLARSTRRRIQRRKQRIQLLKELVAPMVLQVDENFFMKMEKGFVRTDDKGYDFNLFIEDSFNDIQYYEEFKTMYHLRKFLCESNEKADARLIYLALHHIVKYRGNFLYEGQKFEVSNHQQVANNFGMALESITTMNGFDVEISNELVEELLQILMQTHKKRGDKKDACLEVVLQRDKDSKKIITEVINILLGYDSNLTRMFPLTNIQKDGKDYKTMFSSTKYDDDIDFIESALQESFETIELLHNVYSFLTLQEVLNGKDKICDAMIEKYETHKQDLRELKHFVKQYYTLSDYQKIFRNKSEIGNYYAYINCPKTTSKKELYDFLKKLLIKNEVAIQTETYQNILRKIEMDTYLPKQNSKDNGAIPYQMHEVELCQIISNQAIFYPELAKNKDKILSLFKFRVPYYVGPLNPEHDFAWIVKKEAGKIYPWNFDEKVDALQSAELFIRRMTNCCTYLLAEPVIPKKSLLYSRYEVLNELNKVRVNGNLLKPEVKQEILKEVFLEKKKVKSKDIQDFLIRKQYCDLGSEIEITGFQKENEFATSLESWIDFKKMYGDSFEDSIDEIEQIIEWVSVYEDKKILEKRIYNEFPEIEKSKVSKILKMRYKGWGRFSKKLLTGLFAQDKFDNLVTIMDCLEETDKNFMQIINDKKLQFNKLIEKEANKDSNDGKISYEQVLQLQGSPSLKKGIWQTIQIVQELVKTMGSEPRNIFLEFARGDDEKKRTISKVKRLQDIYNEIKKDNFADEEFRIAHNALLKEDKNAKLDNERLYLYYLQQGKCMYSGKALEISKLSTYQIDHIIPQSYIKDDSYENKVLVLSGENQYKGDNLLLSQGTRNKQYAWWKHLHECHLIGDKKFKNLNRYNLSEMEEVGFINRQLVETRQIVKHVANIFKNSYDETTIVSIKAGLSHEFREKFQLYKVREINDYHHAQDAYIASVLGTFVLKKYPILQKEFIFTEYNHVNNFKKDYDTMKKMKNGYGFILNQMGEKQIVNSETEELVWDGASTLHKIIAAFDYKDCFITKKPEERRGQLFNLTIEKRKNLKKPIKEKPHKVIPINKSRGDISKYGGFTSLEFGYAIALEYINKKKLKRIVVSVPRLLMDASKEEIMKYLHAETGSSQITIIKDRILFNQLMEIDGGLYTMASANEFNNARQLVLSKHAINILYELFDDTKQNPSTEDILLVYDEYLEKLKRHYPAFKNLYDKFIQKRDDFASSPNQDKILKEMLKITKENPSVAVLKADLIEISPSAGRLYNKTISLDNTYFIDQSITGLFTKKYRL